MGNYLLDLETPFLKVSPRPYYPDHKYSCMAYSMDTKQQFAFLETGQTCPKKQLTTRSVENFRHISYMDTQALDKGIGPRNSDISSDTPMCIPL